MNGKILLLAVSCFICVYSNAQSYRDNFNTALEAKNMTKAEEILRDWDLANANDPELYIAYFNFYTVKSMETVVPLAKGYDPKYSKQALEFITEGINRFPTRFDMWIAKIFMLGELKDYPAFVEEVIKMIAYSNKIQNNWKREEYMVLDKAEDMFFDAVSDWQGFLFTKKDPTLYKDVIRISEEMLKYYPRHVQSLLNISTVYIELKEFDKSLETLLKAIGMEPDNAILCWNLAYVFNQKGDKANAKKFYEFTISRCKEEDAKLKEAAQKRLEELK